MTYFDTDVLIHSYVLQDAVKHRQANDLMESLSRESSVVISTLSVQEALYVLNRMRAGSAEIVEAFREMMQLQPVTYELEDLDRAFELATNVGFRNINDCIHTAIAETFCTELVTYNRQDFRRIRNFATVNITIL